MKLNQKAMPLKLTSGALLLTLTMLAFCPTIINHHANAEDTITSDVQTQVQTNVQSTVAVSLASNINIDVIPKSTGNYALSSSKLRVTTNSVNGYAVYLQSGTNSNSLKNVDLSSNSEIEAITAPTTLTAAKANSWGYSLSKDDINEESTFTAVPVSTDTATIKVDGLTINDKGGVDEYNLAFGTKIDATLPSGSYSNSVVVSVVANPMTITNLNQLTYMQDMTQDICTNTTEGVTKQLIDTRDGHEYWVARLADGNCWMTQNLSLNLTTAGLKATDTDITSDWNADSTYPPTNTVHSHTVESDTSAGEAVETSVLSWNLGEWVLGAPLKGASCDDTFNIETCESIGAIDVSGWEPTFTAQNGTFNGESTYVAVDQVGHTYDPHYVFGHYYSFNAATAGTGGNITNANASGSICPKGWTLPIAGEQYNSVSISWFNLLAQYGLTENITGTGIYNKTYDIGKSPLYLTYSGRIFLRRTGGPIGSIGLAGNYQTRSATKNIGSSYRMLFANEASSDLPQVRPSDDTSMRSIGTAIRCVTRR